MRRYLVLALAALALVIAAPSAFATRVIFDPPPPSLLVCAPGASCNATNINAIGSPTSTSFQPCSQLPGGVNTQNSTYCLWLNNTSGKTGSLFTFSFTVPPGGSNSAGFECLSVIPPPTVVTNNCPQALPEPGELFTVSFFAKPPLPNNSTDNTFFYLFTDFVEPPGAATVTVSVPEPSELGLFGLGLLALGVAFGWQRRRQTFRSNGAA